MIREEFDGSCKCAARRMDGAQAKARSHLATVVERSCNDERRTYGQNNAFETKSGAARLNTPRFTTNRGKPVLPLTALGCFSIFPIFPLGSRRSGMLATGKHHISALTRLLHKS